MTRAVPVPVKGVSNASQRERSGQRVFAPVRFVCILRFHGEVRGSREAGAHQAAPHDREDHQAGQPQGDADCLPFGGRHAGCDRRDRSGHGTICGIPCSWASWRPSPSAWSCSASSRSGPSIRSCTARRAPRRRCCRACAATGRSPRPSAVNRDQDLIHLRDRLPGGRAGVRGARQPGGEDAGGREEAGRAGGAGRRRSTTSSAVTARARSRWASCSATS